MKKEIFINSAPHEIRIAILEDDDLVEHLIERADSRRIAGNIYKGVVSSVKPGLQAAFVDLGLEKAGFLHASDLVHQGTEDSETDSPPGRGGGRGGSRAPKVPDIADQLKVGDQILVQVTKESIGTKGPRLTADLSLPGHYLVLMPKGRQLGVSRKIEDRRERVRLKQILQKIRPVSGAFIVRTAAESVAEESLRQDVKYLQELWRTIQTASERAPALSLVHEDVGIVVGLLRDIFKDDVDRLTIDEKEDYQRLVKYVKTFAPGLRDRVKLYRGSLPIFDHFEIEAEIKKSLDKRVWLKKGGYIIIEQTEALVSIDVNTGRFTGRRNQEETIFQTNMLAAREVARQLRLRDYGGIIVIDFIDMENESNKKRVLAELRTHLRRDRARTKVFAVSGLGLVEMSRQRIRPSLESQMSEPCPFCTGTGKVLNLDSISNRIERLAHRIASATREQRLQIQANPTLALYLLAERAEQFRELCRTFNLEINVMDDPTLHLEEFRMVSLNSDRDLIAEFEKKARRERQPFKR
jgi:ribonuclease G